MLPSSRGCELFVAGICRELNTPTKYLVSALLLAAGQITVAAQSLPTPFKHILVIVQENRTPDNLFQGLCTSPYGASASCSVTPSSAQYDIQTNRWVDKSITGGVIQPGPVALEGSYDLDHSHTAFTSMCDENPATGRCRMDGAASVGCSGSCPSTPQFKYVANSNGILNPYLGLATQYGWANYMFQTNQGASYPAHQFLFGGTSAPSAADDAAGIFAATNMFNNGVVADSAVAGCFALATTTVLLIGPGGFESGPGVYPCFERQTLPDVLPSTLTWRYYTPYAGSIWTAPNSIRHICESSGPGGKCLGLEWANSLDLNPADVLNDIGSCHLRNLSWVIPSGLNSDHAGSNDGGGPSWVAAIVNAIGSSSKCDGGQGYWKDTAILITWDDWGGWYDHEPPTTLSYPQNSYQYGFRVPLIVVSAYTPQHYINNLPHDFGSILRFVERTFGVREGILNFADLRSQTDLFGFFNFALPPRPFQSVNAAKSADFFLNDKRAATDPDDQ